ncbi:MAG TPA: DUF3560 domain-containing protein, partial [Polyangiaceae bacterium]
MSAAAEAKARRKAVREELVAIRAELRDARRERKRAVEAARERCRADRIAARERARAIRIRTVRELVETERAERITARQTCAERLREARKLPDRATRRHAELVAERRHEREVRKIERATRARSKEAPKEACLACQHETDDEVRAQLPADLLPLFEKVGRSIKAAPGQMRTETFLRYAEKHPDEVLATSEHEAHTRVVDLEAHERSLKKAPNAYEAKREARIDRMRTRAEKLRAESEGASQRAHAIADRIPFGQPILVGHHSEKRHRRDIERIHKGHTRSAELAHEADTLERRAERAEHSTAVSSDDPDAIEKLRAKLERIERDRERMVAANRAVRSADPRVALRELGFSEVLIEKALTPDFLGRVGFPDYALRNAAAEARRIRVRIATLEKRAAGPSRPPMLGAGARVEEGENRVRIVFDAKPDETLRSDLKRAGFHWSPSAGAWQRHASNAAWEQATRIVKAYEPAPVVRLAPVIPFRPSPVTPVAQPPREIVAPTRKVKGRGARHRRRRETHSRGHRARRPRRTPAARDLLSAHRTLLHGLEHHPESERLRFPRAQRRRLPRR